MFRATVVLGLLISVVVGVEVPKEDEDRIVGGKAMMIKTVPCMASLQLREVHKCGAFLISEVLAATAAHCIVVLAKAPIEQITLRIGATIWSQGGQQMEVQKMIPHTEYKSNTNIYDIGIVKVRKSIEFDVTVNVCQLATKVPRDGQNAMICGWGLKKEGSDTMPNMLQSANLTTISREKCKSADYGYGGDIKDTMFCAKGEGIDACQGDSGGPLIIGNEISGITSFGKGCGRKGYPGVYTSVAKLREWLTNYIELYESIKGISWRM